MFLCCTYKVHHVPGLSVKRKLSVMTSALRWAFACGSWKPSEEEWTLAGSSVQPEEKDRIRKFVFKKDAKSAMAGRLLIRKAISDSLSLPWDQIRLERSEKGKPFLANEVSAPLAGFNFNVSHQGEYAVLAAEPCHLVGIDVMKVETRAHGNTRQFFNTMARQFTYDEWKIIKCTPDEQEQLARFYRFWCLKESYVKALGVGIGFDLQRVSFNTQTLTLRPGVMVTDTQVSVDGVLQPNWSLEETMLDGEHYVAVAMQHNSDSADKPPSPSQFQLLSFKDLTQKAKPLTLRDQQYWLNFEQKMEKPPGR